MFLARFTSDVIWFVSFFVVLLCDHGFRDSQKKTSQKHFIWFELTFNFTAIFTFVGLVRKSKILPWTLMFFLQFLFIFFHFQRLFLPIYFCFHFFFYFWFFNYSRISINLPPKRICFAKQFTVSSTTLNFHGFKFTYPYFLCMSLRDRNCDQTEWKRKSWAQFSHRSLKRVFLFFPFLCVQLLNCFNFNYFAIDTLFHKKTFSYTSAADAWHFWA